MYHFLRNSEYLVIPGIDTNSAGVFPVTPEFYETPYGLVMPPTVLSQTAIRFLRNFDRDDPTTYEWVTSETRFFVFYLLNNVGKLELVTIDNEKFSNEAKYVIEITDIPDPSPGWNYMCLLDSTRTMVTNELISGLDKDAAVKWIDERTGNRFQKPILIGLENWRQYRKDKSLDKLFLQSHVFARKA